MGEYLETVRDRLSASVDVKQQMLGDSSLLRSMGEAAELIIQCFRRPAGTVFLAGNGGSACDAQHLAGELVGRFYLNRRGVPAITLGVNPAVATALGNDYRYEDAFVRELDALAARDDVFVAISTSGNSRNILRCLDLCSKKGIRSIGLTGQGGGEMNTLCDVLLRVPSTDTPRIQESHITLGHILCEIVERELFEEKKTS